MMDRREMTDEEFKKLQRLIRLTLLRTAIIWCVGILFLYFKTRHV